ncbi:protein HMF1 [Drechmeria coniospora]|uniref:Protein HMF1 n=1 Tax=Drechmeria coniospora TaxID=98403 RepID=A0A151GNF0_DRECN|nr:protein HMF1 [Drechmeria coniospora]KYK58598.1 protein HMF1 [Drechmeria coniospora]
MADQVNIFTKNAPAPVGPYSQAVKTPTAIYCSGQIPLTPQGTMVEGSIADMTKQCCENLGAVLEEAGSSLAKVVKCNIFISDMAHFAVCFLRCLERHHLHRGWPADLRQEMNSVYEKYFPHKPARSCVAVKTLPKNVDVEIEAIALP